MGFLVKYLHIVYKQIERQQAYHNHFTITSLNFKSPWITRAFWMFETHRVMQSLTCDCATCNIGTSVFMYLKTSEYNSASLAKRDRFLTRRSTWLAPPPKACQNGIFYMHELTHGACHATSADNLLIYSRQSPISHPNDVANKIFFYIMHFAGIAAKNPVRNTTSESTSRVLFDPAWYDLLRCFLYLFTLYPIWDLCLGRICD